MAVGKTELSGAESKGLRSPDSRTGRCDDLRKYRWPLVLFVGIPFVAEISRVLITLVYELSTSGYAGSYESHLWVTGAWSLTAAVLLGVLYSRLPDTEHSILRLAWSYTFVLHVISVPLYFGAAIAGHGDSVWELGGVYMLGALLLLLPMLWFARRASRASLAHAFFLVFIVGGLLLPDFPGSLPFYVEWLWRLAGSILAVWLLANFDVRGPYFRRSAAAAVIVLAALVYLPLLPSLSLAEAIVLLLLSLQLFLIYLVRVRRSAA